jgi:hypothetical protein
VFPRSHELELGVDHIMKNGVLRRSLAAMLAGVLAVPLSPVEAGWFGHDKGNSDCPIGYEEKTVTAYRQEWKTRVVPVVVTRNVSKVVEEPYKYTEYEKVTVPEKRTTTSYKCVTREVPYTYTAQVPVTIPEKRTITTYQCVAKQVPYTYTVKVPVVTTEKRTVTRCISVPEVICKEVPVKKLAKVQVEDPCGGCSHTALKWVTECQTKKTTVYHKVPETKEVETKVYKFASEERTGTRVVHEKVAVQKEVTVNVCTHRTEQRTGTKVIQEKVPVTEEITVNVVKCQPVEKTGIKKKVVCEQVQETIQVTEKYLQCVPYTKTLKVPVYATPACK